ncbi:MAG: hypothetical protein U0800_14450 [Isosphaeraceae bacterium]
MPATLTIRDETPAGGVSQEWSLDFLDETITVRDLIRERVYQEVQEHNARRNMAGPYRGLVVPEGYEAALNGPKAGGKPRPIDARKQFDKAIEAFEGNRVLILIDDRQAESLDESFTIGPRTVVTFLRLTLLVGG